jgi:hypothetical protein
MFTSFIEAIISDIAAKFMIGCVVGATVVALISLIFRSRLQLGIALWGAVCAGLASVIMSFWSAGARGGRLWPYEYPLCVGSSIAVAALISFLSRRTSSQE